MNEKITKGEIAMEQRFNELEAARQIIAAAWVEAYRAAKGTNVVTSKLISIERSITEQQKALFAE